MSPERASNLPRTHRLFCFPQTGKEKGAVGVLAGGQQLDRLYEQWTEHGSGVRFSPGPSLLGWVTMDSPLPHFCPFILWVGLPLSPFLCFFSSLCISRSPLPPLPSGGAFGILGDQLWPQHVPRDTSQVVAVLVPTPQMKTLRSCLQSIRHGQVPGRHSVHTSPSPRPSQSTTSRKPCHTPASGFHGMFCSLSSNPPPRPKALSQETTCFNPISPITLARLHISEGQKQGVAKPSALGGQEASLNEKKKKNETQRWYRCSQPLAHSQSAARGCLGRGSSHPVTEPSGLHHTPAVALGEHSAAWAPSSSFLPTLAWPCGSVKPKGPPEGEGTERYTETGRNGDRDKENSKQGIKGQK